jgi:hypothetical protein
MLFKRKSTAMPSSEDVLPGRESLMQVPATHLVLGTPLTPPFPEGTEQAVFGMGCFWGAEPMFWTTPIQLVGIRNGRSAGRRSHARRAASHASNSSSM